ncbi:MAG: hypothetical protein HFG49_09685 [Lachnospiraceae bacterium]|nr:hypothetical protein [Lachnospiraceae bacterium]
MAVIRCSKGHYYDDTKFSQCPHCGVLPAAEPEKPEKPKRFSFFRKDKEAPPQKAEAPVIPAVPSSGAASLDYDDRTVGLPQMPGGGIESDDRTIAFSQSTEGGYGDDDNQTIAFSQSTGGSFGDDDNQTIAFSQSTGGGFIDDDNRTIAFSHTPSAGVSEDDNRTIAFSHTPSAGVSEDDNRTIAFSHTPSAGVSEDDNRTIAFSHTPSAGVSEDDNRTIAFSHTPSAGVNEDDNRTIAFSHSSGQTGRSSNVSSVTKTETAKEVSSLMPEKQTEPLHQKTSGNSSSSVASGIKQQDSAEERLPLSPEQYVAGWLVCVKGEGKGRDYRLYKGFNRMGCQGNMDILLPKELKDTVCAIVYDDRSNRFYMVQQTGQPVYLNEAEVQKPAELQTGDRIQAGESEFEFIAFCREGRVWES